MEIIESKNIIKKKKKYKLRELKNYE